MKKLTRCSTLLVVSLIVVGCGSKPPAEEAQHPEPMAAKSFPDKEPSKGNIVLSPALAKLCDMPNAYFAFDSAALSSQAEGALDALASCFTTGAAKDRGFTLVGHADPRGEVEYNFGLGQRRAGTVLGFLVSRGVEEARADTSSRGELEATGTDEASWAKDRKVEIGLAQ